MTLILKQLFTFLKLLNSETGTRQIACGLALGIIIGFAPITSLQTIFILALSFIFRIQLGAIFLSAFIFKFIAYLLDPICHEIGRWALESPTLKPLFTTLYNAPLIPFTQFNNTIVMGSALFSFSLFIPLYFVFYSLVKKYRRTVLESFKKSRFWKAIKATSIYRWYHKYEELYGY